MKRNGSMKAVLLSWVIALILIGSVQVAESGELGHYMPGVASVRDFVVPSDPGFYYIQYNLFYTTDTYKDHNGDSVDSVSIGPVTLKVEADVDAYGIQPTFIWVSPWKLLGARYAAFIGTPVLNTSVQAALSTETRFGRSDENQWGLGDLYVKPLWLGWNSKHFGISAGYGFYAPTGEYDDGAVDNTGLGFWTHELQAGITWYPWEHQGTAVMLTGTYELHTEKDGVDITPGDRFSLDWGVSQFLPLNKTESLLVELGVVGYSQWQVDEDSGSDVIQVLNVKDEIHGIGGQIGLAYIPYSGKFFIKSLFSKG